INIWISMTVQSLPESSVVSVHSGWNLFSTPLQQAELCDPELLASASSNAFGYDGSQYVIAHGFRGGKGYWLKFSNPDSFLIAGTAFDSAEVIAGWNMIGGGNHALKVSSIVTDPPGITTGDFFAYTGIYEVADSLKPGNGYWVKANQAGKLFL